MLDRHLTHGRQQMIDTQYMDDRQQVDATTHVRPADCRGIAPLEHHHREEPRR